MKATLPIEPLERFVGGETQRQIAANAGINHRSLHLWRKNGISMIMADRVAIRLGVHPGCIWPQWWSVDFD